MILGITGSIGSGKSFARKIFSEFHLTTYDADSMCHGFYDDIDSEFVMRLRERWGERIISRGAIDRREIGKIVFNDDFELDYLTGLMYPELKKILQAKLAPAKGNKDRHVVIEIPLLFEYSYDNDCDVVATVWTSPEIRYERLKKRGMNIEDIRKREARQFSADKKLALADFGIINNGSIENLKKQCELLLNLR